ncbi:unnamed protein product [Ectocarpus sp. 12 AP-2014]
MDQDAVNIFESLRETVADPSAEDKLSHEITVQNMVRCPFYEKPVDEHQRSQRAKYVKRTQRHRSTAQSRLGDMTVGDIRYCFQQLRGAGKDLNPDMMLYNGETAGEFALKYLRETSTAMRNRRKKLSMVANDSVDDDGETGDMPSASRLGVNGARKKKAIVNNFNVLEF